MAYNHKKLREEIDNYSDTVWATVAFAHECKWNEATKNVDNAVKVGFGRPMTRPDKKEVTPDIVIQRRTVQGIVAEIKHTFPPSSEIERRREIFAQLKSYDVDLLGWWTDSKRIQNHDLVLLTHLSHVTHAVDCLTKDLAGVEIGTFVRNLAIIGYYRSEQDQLYFTLKKEYGSLLDSELSEKLRLSVPIAVRHLIMTRQVRFYDSPPPIPYTLRLLWEQVFPELAQGIARDKKKGYTPIPVTIEALTQTLQKFFGYEPDTTGNRGIPRSEWIVSSLKVLDSLRMAEPGGTAGSYTIRYKTIHGDVLERLGRLCYNLQQKKPKVKTKKSKAGIGQQSFNF
jgi:hypothetical protein